jgi:hypothetical protein
MQFFANFCNFLKNVILGRRQGILTKKMTYIDRPLLLCEGESLSPYGLRS